MTTIDKLGRFPADGPESRKTGVLYKVTDESCLKTVFGREHPVKMNFFVSNDVVHMGELVIPSGGTGSRASEVNRAAGDSCFFVREGPLTFFLPETSAVFHVREGQTMFLPAGTAYQVINYEDRVVRAVFAVAPGL